MVYMVGADPAELDALAARMATAAERLESIRTGIGALLAHSHWDGGDADDFRQLWHHQLAPRLHHAAVMTRAGATTVQVNAQQQREASGIGGVPMGAGMVVPGGPAGVCRDVPERDWLGEILDVIGFGTLGAGVVGFVGDLSKTADTLRKHPAGRLLGSIEKMFESHAALRIVAEKLSFVGLGIDAADFVNEFRKDPTSASTFNAGVATLLSAAGMVPGPVGLVATGLGVIHGFASLDESPEHQEWLRGATLKVAASAAATYVLPVSVSPVAAAGVSLIDTRHFTDAANAAEDFVDSHVLKAGCGTFAGTARNVSDSLVRGGWNGLPDPLK